MFIKKSDRLLVVFLLMYLVPLHAMESESKWDRWKKRLFRKSTHGTKTVNTGYNPSRTERTDPTNNRADTTKKHSIDLTDLYSLMQKSKNIPQNSNRVTQLQEQATQEPKRRSQTVVEPKTPLLSAMSIAENLPTDPLVSVETQPNNSSSYLNQIDQLQPEEPQKLKHSMIDEYRKLERHLSGKELSIDRRKALAEKEKARAQATADLTDFLFNNKDCTPEQLSEFLAKKHVDIKDLNEKDLLSYKKNCVSEQIIKLVEEKHADINILDEYDNTLPMRLVQEIAAYTEPYYSKPEMEMLHHKIDSLSTIIKSSRFDINWEHVNIFGQTITSLINFEQEKSKQKHKRLLFISAHIHQQRPSEDTIRNKRGLPIKTDNTLESEEKVTQLFTNLNIPTSYCMP